MLRRATQSVFIARATETAIQHSSALTHCAASIMWACIAKSMAQGATLAPHLARAATQQRERCSMPAASPSMNVPAPAAADTPFTSPTMNVPAPAAADSTPFTQYPNSTYGASGAAQVKQMRKDAISDLMASVRKRKRCHADYSADMLKRTVLEGIITSTHDCKCQWDDHGEQVECHHRLWAGSAASAVNALEAQRAFFLSLPGKERGKTVYNALTFAESRASADDSPTNWKRPASRVCAVNSSLEMCRNC